MQLVSLFSSYPSHFVFNFSSSRSFYGFQISWVLFTLFFLLSWSSVDVVAQLQTGAKGCKGFDLLKSRYCGFLGNSVLGSNNFTISLQTLFLTNKSTVSISGTPLSLAFSNIDSAAAFDANIMEKVVLPKLNYLTKLWFQCSYDNLGIQWLSSWFCHIMFNLPVKNQKEPCFVQGTQVPLCASTREELLTSVERHYYKDSSCDTSTTGKAKFQKHFQTIKASFRASPDFSGSKNACLEGKKIEPSIGYCGWANTPESCDVHQRALKADLSSNSSSSNSSQYGWIIGGSIAGGLVLISFTAWMIMKGLRHSNKTPQVGGGGGVFSSENSTSSMLEGKNRPFSAPTSKIPFPSPLFIPPPPSSSSSSSSTLSSPSPMNALLPHGSKYTLYNPRDVESILPEDSVSNVGWSRSFANRNKLSELMAGFNDERRVRSYSLPSPTSSTVIS
ncbi:hypothetical protein HMI54_006745 [Coelomomyces lativittatus]|nr:hypothetical protein HMI54_006745 [Coelomomyces lativittatus]KAJ1511075.1 hypothetical protein HMI56_005845 [Coelomomyces lativittatus]KAJ1516992.1 hypothetical protein HMI55_000889 [Coelomomyces lativittatus]